MTTTPDQIARALEAAYSAGWQDNATGKGSRRYVTVDSLLETLTQPTDPNDGREAQPVAAPKNIAALWEKTQGKAWEPPKLDSEGIKKLIDGGWVKRCTMRCGFEAFDTGVNWTEAAKAALASTRPDAAVGREAIARLTKLTEDSGPSLAPYTDHRGFDQHDKLREDLRTILAALQPEKQS